MTRRDFVKPAFPLRKKRFVKTHALSLLGTTRLLSRSDRKLQQLNIVCTALATGLLCAPVYAEQQEADHKEIVLQADTLFDGIKIYTGAGPYAVRVGSNGKITQVGLATQVRTEGAKIKYYKGGPFCLPLLTHTLTTF